MLSSRRSRFVAALVAVCTAAHALGRIGLPGAEPTAPIAARVDTTTTPLHQQTRFRKPIAAALAAEGRYLVVANRRSGTVSLLDCESRMLAGEFAVSDRLAAMAGTAEGRRFALVDDKRNELILARIEASLEGPKLVVVARASIADDPAGLALSLDGRFAAVAGRWSHRIQVLDLAIEDAEPSGTRREPRTSWPESIPRVTVEVSLPFAPREVLWIEGDTDRLLVADAFGGRVSVVELREGNPVVHFECNGHAVRGLAYHHERREIVFAYQRLDQNLPTTPEAISEGRLIANYLRRTTIAELVSALEPTVAGAQVAGDSVRPWPGRDERLDRPGMAAADPQYVAVSNGDSLFVALGGSNQLVEVQAGRRAEVGRRPSAVVVGSAGRTAFVVDQLSDSVSVVDLGPMQTMTAVSLGPSPELYPRDRGERLFFDARQSPGGFVSCHSCHVDGHSSGLRADTLGDGTYGTPKRILTLMGTALTDQWAWNGEIRELRDQVRRSLETTMHVPPMRAADHDDVAAFLHTLPFPKPAAPSPSDADSADLTLRQQGESIFAARNCGQCHVGPLTYTSQPAFDVGLRDERGMAKFNPPSLRGASQNPRFFHDNRCASLEEVFRDERHQLDEPLSEPELNALTRFLKSL